jgi:hypothetical protein
MLVREATPLDATELAELIQQVENTSQYMLWEPGERTIQPNQQQKMIEKIQGEDNSTILVAEQDDHLIGYLFAIGGKPNKTGSKSNVGVVILCLHPNLFVTQFLYTDDSIRFLL